MEHDAGNEAAGAEENSYAGRKLRVTSFWVQCCAPAGYENTFGQIEPILLTELHCPLYNLYGSSCKGGMPLRTEKDGKDVPFGRIIRYQNGVNRMTEKERMLAGELYDAHDPELRRDAARSRRITRLFNNTTEEQQNYRRELLKELFGSTGENIYIEPPFRCDYGSNTYIGENFYANFDCIILDVAEVYIGSNCLFGPRVCVYTPCHPIDAGVRNTGLESGKAISIGNNVWIGGNAVINPGVTIGNNVVIGSGSVVTKDIPDNVVAAGNPCRVLRPITEEDKQYWSALLDEYRRSKVYPS